MNFPQFKSQFNIQFRSMTAAFALTASLAAQLISAPAHAEIPKLTLNESSIMSRFLEEIMNTMDRASVDFELNNYILDSKTEVTDQNLSAKIQIRFKADWKVQLIEKTDTTNTYVEKFLPILNADSKNLVIDFKYADVTEPLQRYREGQLRLFDAKTNKPRSLTFTASNQMTKDAVTVRLHSAEFKMINDKVVGTCDSDKVITSVVTGKKVIQKVDCSLTGVITEDGYKFKIKYTNSKS